VTSPRNQDQAAYLHAPGAGSEIEKCRDAEKGSRPSPFHLPRWLAAPLARDLLHGYKREVEGPSGEFPFFFPFHPFATSQTPSLYKQAVSQTRLHFYTSLDTYSSHCLTFVSTHHHTTLHLYTHTSLSPTSLLSFDTTPPSSWRTNKTTTRPPSPSLFLTKFNTRNTTFLKVTATPFLLLRLPSLSLQAPG
jgi:hypothetical protein